MQPNSTEYINFIQQYFKTISINFKEAGIFKSQTCLAFYYINLFILHQLTLKQIRQNSCSFNERFSGCLVCNELNQHKFHTKKNKTQTCLSGTDLCKVKWIF